jgi:hypothetical protein
MTRTYRIGLAAICLAALTAANASAQSWTAPRTWTTGELVTSSIMNTHIRDNELVLRAGGFSVSSQAIGDLLCASSTTQFARLADVATGSVLISGGVGACPSWSSSTVAMLAAVNTFTAFGVHTFSAGSTGANAILVRNTSAGTTNTASIRAGNDSSATLMNMEAYSSTFTSGTYNVANGGAVFSTGAGGLSVMASDALGEVRFLTGGTTVRGTVANNGVLNWYNSNGTTAAQIAGTSIGSATTAAFTAVSGTYGTGNVSGSWISIGRNLSGNGAAGLIQLVDRLGNANYVWADASATPGMLRISTAKPEEDGTPSDTSGTIVGTQTSTLDTKLLIAPFTDTAHALDVVSSAPLWRFQYKGITGPAYGGSEFVGVMSNTTPEVMMDPSPEHPEGRSFSPVSAFGYTAAAIAELRKQIEHLRNPYFGIFGEPVIR